MEVVTVKEELWGNKKLPFIPCTPKKAIGKREFDFTFFSLIEYNIPIRKRIIK